jgi:hypothetical protein
MVYPGAPFHRRQRGIPMHSYENRSEIRARHWSHVEPRADPQVGGFLMGFATGQEEPRASPSLRTNLH